MAADSAASAGTERALTLAHGAVTRSRDLQLDFASQTASPPPPDWLMKLLRDMAFLAPVVELILWGGLAAGAVLILWLVAREFVRIPGSKRKTAATAMDWRPDAAAAQALLEDADALAARERYDEAVRVLLFRSVEDINSRRPGAIRPALTARDIGALAVIPEEPRGAFSRIIQVVEHSLFGARAVDRSLFDRCRDDYRTFAFSEAWR